MEASGERLEQLISWHKCHSTKIGDTRRWNGWPESFHDLQKLVRALPALCYSKSQPDDVDTEAQDHCYDALRYGLTRRKIELCSVRVRMPF